MNFMTRVRAGKTTPPQPFFSAAGACCLGAVVLYYGCLRSFLRLPFHRLFPLHRFTGALQGDFSLYREPARLRLPKEAAVQVRHSTLESGAVKSAALHARPADAKNVHLHFRYVLRSHLRFNGVFQRIDLLRDLPPPALPAPADGIPLSSGLSCSWLLLLSVVCVIAPKGLPPMRGAALGLLEERVMPLPRVNPRSVMFLVH